LRLYGELGLLPPHTVDAETGYRSYTPDQISNGHARAAAFTFRGAPLEAYLEHFEARLSEELAPEAESAKEEAKRTPASPRPP